MKSVSNILFSIMMAILFVMVSVWYFIMYLLDQFMDLLEEGTQKSKNLENEFRSFK